MWSYLRVSYMIVVEKLDSNMVLKKSTGTNLIEISYKWPNGDLQKSLNITYIFLQRRSRIAVNQSLETWVGSLENCLHFQTEYWVIFAHHLQGITVFVFPTTIGMLRNEQGNIMEYPDMGRINKRSLFAQLQAFDWRRPFGWAARIEGFKCFFWNPHGMIKTTAI